MPLRHLIALIANARPRRRRTEHRGRMIPFSDVRRPSSEPRWTLSKRPVLLQTHPGALAVKLKPTTETLSGPRRKRKARSLEIEPFPRPGPSTERVSSSRCHKTPPRARTRVTETVFKGQPSRGANGEWKAKAKPFAIRHSLFARLAPPGGARRDRTDDLMLAKHALSQLSYGPEGSRQWAVGSWAATDGGEPQRPSYCRLPIPYCLCLWWAWEDLNLRPHAYQARALTN